VVSSGVKQPGDGDSTRTYELAASCCFFLHQSADYVSTVAIPQQAASTPQRIKQPNKAHNASGITR
jgi:hypothetical protein